MVTFFKKTLFSEKAVIAGLRAGGVQRRMHENELYTYFFYLIKQYSRKYSLAEEDAASAYSDTIITVIDHVISGRFEGRSSLKSYTCQIFMNKCVDLVRKNTTDKSTVHRSTDIESLVATLPDKTRNIIQDLISKSEKAFFLEKLKAIGEKCRQILLLFEDGYSDREIALQMEYKSADVVKTSRMRCLEKLKEQIFTTHT